ncbi:CpaD family pilus assembly lipoprotein [Sphingomonas sp. HT-1]|uniref:CpaD family pilus assembly lipoprotein n=1 Tax=unclassified Sphingomonas TaxID=196159 RepID=UPI0002D4ED5D|nr:MULTISPECIES: CpaD family pilus assembly lipoprotein [unclassified Sphingomonas]
MFPRTPRPLLAAPVLLLAACTGYSSGLESVHQPVVTEQRLAIDVRAESGGLAADETQRLGAWMAALGLRYGDSIAVDDGAEGALARADVAALASRYGLTLAERAPATLGAVSPGTVRVVVSRSIASVPGCPEYARPAAASADASTGSTFGCATNSNLAAMVADPAHLVRGVSDTATPDPATSAKAIAAYRAAAPSGGGGTTVKAESTGGSPR